MMASVNAFEINGIVDTSQTVLDNLNTLATASGCWLTYDVGTGRWSVIINRAGSSTKSFDDGNIIGGISVRGTGLVESYNKVTVQFPHKDLRDQIDYIDLVIPAVDRYENEQDNTLNIQFDIVNDPIQAQYIAAVELKQSRVDRVIEFRTDYSALGLKAGDLIDITAESYGFTNKVFRVTRVNEIDNDDTTISLEITALEYDANIYDSTGLVRSERTKKTGILPKITNEELKTKDDISIGDQLERLLLSTATTGLLNYILTKNPLTGKVTQSITPKDATRDAVLSKIKEPALTIVAPPSICEGSTLTIVLEVDPCACLLDTDAYEYSYTITGVQAADITPFPLTGKTKAGIMSIPIALDGTTETESLTLTVGSNTKTIVINDKLSFTYSTTAAPISITEGATSTVTLTTTGVADGTVVPYTITGDGTGRVSTALTGNVTVNSNSATLSVVTINDSVYTGNQTVTVTFNAAQADLCGQLDKTAAITIVDNETAPAANTTCEYVSVPVVWCGTYDGADDQLSGVTVLYSASLPKALAGEATVNVPKTLTVTKGNPSTITVATTEAVASSALLGGIPFKVITTFNTVAPKGLITGSASSTVYGF